MPEDEPESMTVREFIHRLTLEASALPAGLESPINLSICNGRGDQYLNEVDINHWFEVHRETLERSGRGWVLVRGHWHPGELPGKYFPGENLEQEIDKLVAGEEDPGAGPEPGHDS
jgi:hypothetical protein